MRICIPWIIVQIQNNMFLCNIFKISCTVVQVLFRFCVSFRQFQIAFIHDKIIHLCKEYTKGTHVTLGLISLYHRPTPTLQQRLALLRGKRSKCRVSHCNRDLHGFYVRNTRHIYVREYPKQSKNEFALAYGTRSFGLSAFRSVWPTNCIN
jgi:hypothetical protein